MQPWEAAAAGCTAALPSASSPADPENPPHLPAPCPPTAPAAVLCRAMGGSGGRVAAARGAWIAASWQTSGWMRPCPGTTWTQVRVCWQAARRAVACLIASLQVPHPDLPKRTGAVAHSGVALRRCRHRQVVAEGRPAAGAGGGHDPRLLPLRCAQRCGCCIGVGTAGLLHTATVTAGASNMEPLATLVGILCNN